MWPCQCQCAEDKTPHVPALHIRIPQSWLWRCQANIPSFIEYFSIPVPVLLHAFTGSCPGMMLQPGDYYTGSEFLASTLHRQLSWDDAAARRLVKLVLVEKLSWVRLLQGYNYQGTEDTSCTAILCSVHVHNMLTSSRRARRKLSRS